MPDWGIINKADPSLEYTTQFWSTDKNAVAWEKEASFPGRMLYVLSLMVITYMA